MGKVHVTGVQGTRIDLVMAFCSRPSEGNVKDVEMNSRWLEQAPKSVYWSYE